MTTQDVAPAFDYGQLSGDDWKFVEDARDEIRRLGKQTVEAICEIGRLLTEVKQRLPHGQWLPWLKAEFAWSERTAQRFMNSHALIKSANLADLPRLLELPPSAVADLELCPESSANSIMVAVVGPCGAARSVVHRAAGWAQAAMRRASFLCSRRSSCSSSGALPASSRASPPRAPGSAAGSSRRSGRCAPRGSAA
jgi:hypothetical protein